jgi:hypothetical protein
LAFFPAIYVLIPASNPCTIPFAILPLSTVPPSESLTDFSGVFSVISPISPVLSSVFSIISTANNFPASIAASSEPSLASSSSLLVTSFLKIISFLSISACYLPSMSTTGIPFLVMCSESSI